MIAQLHSHNLAGPALAIEPPAERLTTVQWAALLVASAVKPNLSAAKRALQLRKLDAERTVVRGGMTWVIPSTQIPAEWLGAIEARREQYCCRSFGDLLELETRPRWTPRKPWEAHEEPAKEAGEKRQAVMDVYYRAQDLSKAEKDCVAAARVEWRGQFGEECSDKTIRRLRDRIEERGGQRAPREAYLDGRNCDHVNSRVEVKLGIPDELIAEIKSQAVKMGAEHMSSVYDHFVKEWYAGREVPGLGVRQNRAPFPFAMKQLRKFFPPTAARIWGARGTAAAVREALPWIHSTTASLRPLELVTLDDTRIDLIATDDRNPSRLVELKSYWVMDVASRKIVAFTVVPGQIGKEDVFPMLCRMLRGTGLPIGYAMHIIFERGSVACAPATETLLRSIWPGRIEVHRTGMDGGRDPVSGFHESKCGHFMGKSWIESFMRTLAFTLENLPGQRGRNFRLQPQALGNKGRDHTTGALKYDKGSAMHQAALTGFAQMTLDWHGNGDSARLKHNALRPVSWVIRSITEAIELYNSRTDHRREGFAIIEESTPAGLVRRVESSNERWSALSDQYPTERIRPADAASLLRYRGKMVTVSAREGVTTSVVPGFPASRFWRPDSLACHGAAQLSTQERRMVALYDHEAFAQAAQGVEMPLEIHLLEPDGNPEAWKPGDGGRYLETLPLVSPANRLDAAEMGQARDAKMKVVARMRAELLQAGLPALVKQLDELTDDEGTLKGVITQLDLTRAQMAGESELLTDVRSGESRAEARARDQAEERLGDAATIRAAMLEDF